MQLRKLLIALLVTLGTALPLPGHADEKTVAALQTTEQLLNDAHRALGSSNHPALRDAITTAFAFEVWERFLLEHRKDSFGPSEKEEFRLLLPGFMAYLYNDQFQRGLSAAPTLGEARSARRGDVLVASRFPRTNGRELPVEWRIRALPGRGPQVIDVMVAGTSFVLLKRDEFTAIIDQGGAAALLDYMRAHSF